MHRVFEDVGNNGAGRVRTVDNDNFHRLIPQLSV
jgi:hypothetical protein